MTASRLRLLWSCCAMATAAAGIVEAAANESGRSRPLSPRLSAAVTESLPTYQPTRTASAAGDETAADADIDLPAPRNGIVRLPRVVVEGRRPPVFTERELHTDRGLAELAVKRYFNEFGLALNRFRLPLVGIGTEAWALAQWQEDERLRLISLYSGQAERSSALGDDASARELQALIQSTLARPAAFHGSHRVPYRDARGE